MMRREREPPVAAWWLSENSQPRAPQQWLEMYIKWFGARRARAEIAISADTKFDSVPAHLRGQVKVGELLSQALRCPWSRGSWFGLRLLLDERDPRSISLPEASQQDYAANCARKGVSPGAKRKVDPATSAAIRKLMEPPNPMFRRWGAEALRVFAEKGRNATTVSAFLVEKSNLTLRLILDSRLANCWFARLLPHFSIFTVETVRQVFANLSDKEWHVLNFDIRHAYHEMRLPIYLAGYFMLHLAGLSGTDTRDETVVPTTLPMGFSASALMSQSVMYAMLLGRTSPTRNERDDLPREWLESLLAAQEKATATARAAADPATAALRGAATPPAWIPLVGGGMIAVIIDNICIVTPKKETAEWWFEHITSAARKFGLCLKTGSDDVAPRTDQDWATKKQWLRENCFLSLKPGDDTTFFDFAGVRWTHESHRVIVPDSDVEDPQLARFEVSGPWRVTARQLASVVGRIMWSRRVCGERLVDTDAASRCLRKIYVRLGHVERCDWDKMFALEKGEREIVVQQWQRRNAMRRVPYMPLRTQFSNVVRIATDAASTQHLMGVVRLGASAAASLFKADKYDVSFHIALGELAAVVFGVRWVLADSPATDLILLAIDNTNVKNWIENFYADNEVAMSLLDDLAELLEYRKLRENRHGRTAFKRPAANPSNVRLFTVYVPSALNVADAISRGADKIEPELFVDTMRYLDVAETEARGAWSVAGDVTGGANMAKTALTVAPRN
jgi:hypothetical protein